MTAAALARRSRHIPWLFVLGFAIVVAVVMAVAFFLRTTTELTVQRDRSPNFVRLSNGDIRNSYTVKILNKQRQEQQFQLVVDGLPQARLGFVGAEVEGSGPSAKLTVHADSVGTFRVFVTVPAVAAPAGSKSIAFAARDSVRKSDARHDAVFVGPGR